MASQPPKPERKMTTIASTVPMMAPRWRVRGLSLAQARCHIDSEKMVVQMREVPSVKMEV